VRRTEGPRARDLVTTATHWAGLVLLGGALTLGVAIVLISLRPVVGQIVSPDVAVLLLSSAALLLLSLPAMYAVQADEVGAPGLIAHALLATGLLLLVVVAATPLLQPSLGLPTGEHPILFVLGIALTIGLLLTGITTFQAGVLPRPAAALLLAATAGFFFVFFVAEFLPAAAGQVGSAVFGILLALGFGWIGWAMWLRT
jgi:hypothetical protein